MKTEVKYSSDLTNRQWQLIRQLLPRKRRLGRRPIDRRRIINAILYVVRTGCQWRMLPRDFPNWSTVYGVFWRWRDDGTWQKIHDALRAKARRAVGKKSTPTVAIVDSQSIRTAEGGEQRGYDSAKKITGRKRHLAVDTLGLLLAVVVHSASCQDQDGAKWVMEKLGEQFCRIKVVFGDFAYGRNNLPLWVQQTFGWLLQTVLRPVGVKGFVVLPKRWIVERTFAWLARHRRHSKDYEKTTASAEALTYIAMIGLMSKRLAYSKKLNFKTRSKTTGTVGNLSHGSRETPVTSVSSMEADRSEKARCHKSDRHVAGESDSSIVPEKPANNGGLPLPAESVEGRELTEENTGQSLLDRTQRRNSDAVAFVPRSRGLLGVREAAGKDKKLRFTSLLHHITPELLRASFFDLKKQAAPGIDGEMWRDYAKDFESRIDDLHGRIHRGAYRAKPSKRTYIPKADGKLRPLGVAALEDKIVQQATRTVLECIYEQDFLGFSYGFRPGRGCHRALDALYVGITKRKVNWILDADIRGFFDNISHEWLMKFLEHRIADRRMQRLLKKWLRAGVSEDGAWSPTKVGTPQGAVISPLYANVFLHYVLDLWIDDWRKRHAQGEVIIVRYADDFVIGFREESDARRCLADLKERFTKFGLELHPEKTRLIEFGRYAEERRTRRGAGPPETFDFLGFTHISGKTRRGDFTIHRKTSRKKVQAKLADLKEKLSRRRHDDLLMVAAWLQSVFRGWCQYYAVPGNYARLRQFRDAIQVIWLRTLRRRSQRGRRLTWEKFSKLCKQWLPTPKILHPYPNVRFACQHPR